MDDTVEHIPPQAFATAGRIQSRNLLDNRGVSQRWASPDHLTPIH